MRRTAQIQGGAIGGDYLELLSFLSLISWFPYQNRFQAVPFHVCGRFSNSFSAFSTACLCEIFPLPIKTFRLWAIIWLSSASIQSFMVMGFISNAWNSAKSKKPDTSKFNVEVQSPTDSSWQSSRHPWSHSYPWSSSCPQMAFHCPRDCR